jgi:hypothetical protein
VENDGIIRAPNGQILLAAGRVVKLIDVNLPGVSIDVGGIKGKVTNLGQIMASAGTIGISAGLIKNSGTISASSVEKQGGRIFLRASDTLTTTATSDISANGTTGGNVVLYSDAGADIDGSVSALGSAGNGGYVDTSGKQSLSVKYVPKIGPGGEWYIDPYNVEIVADATLENALSGVAAILAIGSSATIHASTISTLLSAGTSVTVATGGTGSLGSDVGDITVNAAITKVGTAAASLTLNAANNININQSISDGSTAGNNGGLSLLLNAGYTGAGVTGAPTSSGTINATGANITVGAGLLANSTVFNYVGAGSSMNLYGASTIGGTLSLTGGTINLNGASTLNSIVMNAGTINVKAATAVSFINMANSGSAINLSAALSTGTLIMQNGAITSAAPSTLTVSTALDHTGGAMSLDAGVFTQTSGNLSLGALSANNLTLNATAGNIEQTQAVTAGVLVANASGNVSLNNSANQIQSLTASSGAGGVSLVNLGALALGAVSAINGNVVLTTTGAITQTAGGITTGQNLIVSSGAGTTLNSVTNNVGGFQATNTGSGDISLTNTAANLALNGSVRNLATSGNVTIVNDGNITGTVNRDGGGTIINTTSANHLVTLTSNNGSVTLGPVTATNLTVNAVAGAISETPYGMAVVSGIMTANAANGISLPSNSCGTNRIAFFVATNTTSGDITLGNGNTGGVTSKLINISNTGGGDVTVTNVGSLQTVSSGTISGQNVSLSTKQSSTAPATTDLVLNGQLTAAATVTLDSAEGSVTQNGGGITSALLVANAVKGISLTAGTNAVAAFNASNHPVFNGSAMIVVPVAGDIALLAHTAGAPGKLDVNVASNGNGSINIENYGAMETHEQVSATGGSVTLKTHSPLTIGGGGVTASTGVTLTAGNIAAATGLDDMTVNGVVTTSGGNATLVAGNTMTLSALVSAPAGIVSLTSGVAPVLTVMPSPAPVIQIGAPVIPVTATSQSPGKDSVVVESIKKSTGVIDQGVTKIQTVQTAPLVNPTTASLQAQTTTKQTIGGGDGEFGGSSTDGASGSGTSTSSDSAKSPAKTMFCS